MFLGAHRGVRHQSLVDPVRLGKVSAFQRIAGGQHDDRRITAGVFTQPLTKLIAVRAGQHDIEHDQVVMIAHGQMQARYPVLRTIHCVALELQVIHHVGEDVAVILNDQNTHAGGSPETAQLDEIFTAH